MPASSEPFGEGDRGVLRPRSWWWIRPDRSVMPSRLPGPDGVLDGVQDQCGVHGGGGPPADDPPGVGVDDERDIDPARPGRDIGKVRHPKHIRRCRVELAIHQITGPDCLRVGDGGPLLLPAPGTGQAQLGASAAPRCSGPPRCLRGAAVIQTLRAP